jgi:adenylate cyclase
MGEILSFAGRAEEAEIWVRKAIRLNPYHPPRYWSHLARALFHTGRYREAIDALQNIRAPRVRERAFQVAAASMLGDAAQIAESVAALRKASPDFDPERFVENLPYDDARYGQPLLDALSAVLA